MAKILPVILLLLLLVLPGSLFPKYPPGLHWKEIANDHFVVVFPAEYREEAAVTLDTAQYLYDRLTQLWGSWIKIRGKTRILILDAVDDSNGLSTFFPYNHIVIYLFTPPPDSTIGSARDWIRMVLTHELTHIFNFNAGSGFTYFLRKFLGGNPLFFPIIYMPEWVMEGLAIYAESQLDAGGRLNTPDFALMIGYIANAGMMPDWGDFWGEPTPWPGGSAKYLYGAAFVDFLVRKYGRASLQKIIKNFAYYPIPFTVSGKLTPRVLTLHQRFRQVLGKDMSALWEEFLRQVDSDAQKTIPASGSNPAPSANKTRLLTLLGKYKKYPLLTRDEKIYYVNHNFKEFPGIYLLDSKTGMSARVIKQQGITGMYYSEAEKKIYFSASDYFKSFYRYSDIYALDLNTRSVARLSKGDRLFYPVNHPDAVDKIYCVKRVNSLSYLALLDLKTNRCRLLSRGFPALAFIALSPDNRFIAASLKDKNQDWSIVLFNRDGQLEKILTGGLGNCYYPRWNNNDDVFFVCQWEHSYRLASVNLGKNLIYIYDDPHIPALSSFSMLPGKGDKIAAAFFTANGFNLGLTDLQGLQKREIKPGSARVPLGAKQDSGVLAGESAPPHPYKIKPYHFLRELAPKYFNGDYRSGGNEFQPGIMISGHDLTLQNSYSIEAFYGFRSKTGNFIFDYTYDGLYPTLSLRYSDLSDFESNSRFGHFIYQKRELALKSVCPLLVRSRRQAYLYSDIHFETRENRFLDAPDGSEVPGENRTRLNGLKLGFFYRTAQRYYDAISRADGIALALSYAREFKFLGSDYDMHCAAFQYKHYISLGRPNVLAFHLGITDSWGKARRLFYMGGEESKEAFHVAGNNLLDLMRGFPSGYFAGTGGYLLNVEYRISLVKIENVLWFSRSIERLYLTLFADIGNVWVEKWELNPSYSLGMEVNLVFFLGDMKLNAAGGIALGQHPYHTPRLYVRLGNSY